MFHGGQWILDHVFNIKINVDLLQRKPHAGTFEIGKHDEFDIGRGLVVVQLVLIGTEGDKTGDKHIIVSNWLICPRQKGNLTCHPRRLACGPYSGGRKQCRR